MHPDQTRDLVATAYRHARFKPSLARREPGLRRVLQQIAAMRAQQDRVVQVLDFKTYNRQAFESDAPPEQLDTVPFTIKRLLTTASMDATMGLFLYEMVRRLEPRSCVEIGACLGVSGMYIAAGLVDNGVGKLLNFEGDPNLAQIARDNLEAVAPGFCEVVVGPFDETVSHRLGQMTTIDFAFSDQEHFFGPTIRDLEAIAPRMPAGGVLVIDDIHLHGEMVRTWEALSRDPRCRYAITPYRLGRSVRLGVWVRGQDGQEPPTAITIGEVFDRPNPLIDAARRLKRRLAAL